MQSRTILNRAYKLPGFVYRTIRTRTLPDGSTSLNFEPRESKHSRAAGSRLGSSPDPGCVRPVRRLRLRHVPRGGKAKADCVPWAAG